MVRLYPKGHVSHNFVRVEPTDGKCPQLIIHPSTAELAEQLVIDPEALKNENYPGIFDADGDFVPMYCDDPEKIPQASIPANIPTGVEPKPAESPENVGGETPPSESEKQ